MQCPLRDCDEQSLWCGLRLAQGRPNWLQKRKIRDERKKAKRIRQLIANAEQAYQAKIAELNGQLANVGKWHPIVHRGPNLS